MLSHTNIYIFLNQLLPVSLLEEFKIFKSASPMDYVPIIKLSPTKSSIQARVRAHTDFGYACSQHPVREAGCSSFLLSSTRGLVMKGSF